MYAIKAGWVGQTFALATSSDSGGRKSRIRRSKEERKTMAESFIKKYQKLNNGNFPSLNLAHKEVGGSFYTVREIVREIIQENRVLGPAKFLAEEQNNNKLLEQFPLGSISIEPQISTEETDVTSLVRPNEYYSTNEEDISNYNGRLSESEHQRLRLDNEHVVNGSNMIIEEDLTSGGLLGTPATSFHSQISNAEQLWDAVEKFTQRNHQELNNEEVSSNNEAFEEDEESEEPILVSAKPIPCHEVSQECDRETNKEQVGCSGVEYPGNGHLLYNAEEIVNEISEALEETSDCGEKIDTRETALDTLDSAMTQTNNLEVSNGRTDVKGDILVETFPLHPVAKTIHDFEGGVSDDISVPKTFEAKGIEHDSTNSSCSVDAKDVANLAGQTVEKISQPLEEKELLNIGDSPLENSELSAAKGTHEAPISSLVGEKHLTVTEMISNEKNLDGVKSSIASGHHIPKENTATKSKPNIRQDISNKEKGSPTLDRINLKTWEGASQKSAGQGSNPIFTLFKGFITAFVKFWTE